MGAAFTTQSNGAEAKRLLFASGEGQRNGTGATIGVFPVSFFFLLNVAN